MDQNQESESTRVKSKSDRQPRDRDLQGGARGGDPAARPQPKQKQEPPIIEKTP